MPVIESQIDIMVAVHFNLDSVRDDLISESAIKAFRLIDSYLFKNKTFNGQFANALRNVCRQVTLDHLRRMRIKPKTEQIRADYPTTHKFPDPFHTVENDILEACNCELDVAVVQRRANGMIQQAIADELGISRTQVINRLRNIEERYRWRQTERTHERFTIRKAS